MRIETDSEAVPDHDENRAESPIEQPTVAGLPRRAETPIMVGSADDGAEHAADAAASRVVAALRRQRTIGQLAEQTGPHGPALGAVDALRRQADRTGVVGPAGGAAPAPVADRLNRPRGGGVPLTGAAREAFEGALGADLGSVRLHAGPEAAELNRQVGARAFTLGRDVFFADGVPDLATESGQHLLAHELAHAISPAAGGPVRRTVVTQLLLEPDIDDVVRIRTVSIVGRPPPTFSGSMGDHSTAFTVHVNAVQLALENHPLAEAAARMQDLVAGLGRLPGASLVGSLPPRQAKMFEEAHARLLRLHALLHAPAKGLNLAATVQEYVAAYLELRELVPLSTVNTGTVSKATSGKGKGEDCMALRAQSAGSPQRRESLVTEVVDLLDVRAVALACAEPDPERLAALAPGLSATLDATERARLFLAQHLLSLQTAFPGALAGLAEASGLLAPDSSAPSGKDPRAAARDRDQLVLPRLAEELLETVLPRVWECLFQELPVMQKALQSVQAEVQAAQPISETAGKRKRGLDTGKSSKQGLALLAKLQEREQFLLGRVNAIEKLLKLELTPSVAETRRKVVGARKEQRVRKQTQLFNPKKIADQAKEAKRDLAVQRERALLDAPAEPVLDPASLELPKDEEVAEEADRDGSLAVQVVIGDAGVVTEVRSAGRPRSPFAGGTMGAHTTAWTVHLDRVRQLVVNKSIAGARKAVAKDLAADRKRLTKQWGKAFSFPEDSRLPAGSAGSCEHDEVVSLQNEIVAHLEAINSIPGATLPAADTGGKSEGKHRRVLLERLGLQQYAGKPVKHPEAEVFAAIVGLLDLGSLNQEVDKYHDLVELEIDYDADPAVLLAQQHLLSIEDSYPGALAAAGLKHNSSSAKRVARAAQAEKGDSDSTKTKSQPTKRRKVEGADGKSLSVPVDADSAPEAEPAVGKPMSWDPSIFGALFDDSIFDDDLDLYGGLLSGKDTYFPAPNEQAAEVGADWIDEHGNLLETKVPTFIEAYRADINDPRTYLAEVEGPAVASAFGINVPVYRDDAPVGFSRIENIGGGNCLIHACSDLRAAMDLEARGTPRAGIPAALGLAAGRAVTGDEILRIRKLVSDGVQDDDVSHAVCDIVLNKVEGRPNYGIGPQLRALLRSPNLLFKAAIVRDRLRLKEAQKSLDAKEELKKPVKPKRGSKKPATPAPVVPAPIQPQLTYGAGAVSDDYALLHVGDNHYVALVRTR